MIILGNIIHPHVMIRYDPIGKVLVVVYPNHPYVVFS